MITSKIRRKTNNLEKLAKKIKALSRSSVKSGYFSDQGNHPTADMPYTTLAYIHATGFNGLPERDIRLDTIYELSTFNFKPLLNKYFYKDLPVSSVTSDIAFRVEDIAQSLFGVPSVNNPDNSEWWARQKAKETGGSGNTPLIHYGYLRDAWNSRIVNVGED